MYPLLVSEQPGGQVCTADNTCEAEHGDCILSVRDALITADDLHGNTQFCSGSLASFSGAVTLQFANSSGRSHRSWLWAQVGECPFGARYPIVDGASDPYLGLPSARSSTWRPLVLIEGSTISIRETPHPSCGIQFLYKGRRHPSQASRCGASDFNVATGFCEGLNLEPPIMRASPKEWYGLSKFDNDAAMKWLTTFMFDSNGAIGMFVSGDGPSELRPIDAFRHGSLTHEDWRSNAQSLRGFLVNRATNECLFSLCAPYFAKCYTKHSCRSSLAQFADKFREPPWDDHSVLSFIGEDRPLRNIVNCFRSKCSCYVRKTDKRAHVKHFKQLLTDRDVEAVLRLADTPNLGTEMDRYFGVHMNNAETQPTGHHVTFLTSKFEETLPYLFQKLRNATIHADEESNWSAVNPDALNPHTIELLNYSSNAAGLGWHPDQQSSVTTLVMLSDKTDFQGAELQHMRGVDGSVHSTHLQRGDVAVYRGNQLHRVAPLKSGSRLTLAIEWWHVVGIPYASMQTRYHFGSGKCPL